MKLSTHCSWANLKATWSLEVRSDWPSAHDAPQHLLTLFHHFPLPTTCCRSQSPPLIIPLTVDCGIFRSVQVASYHRTTLEITELLRATHSFIKVCRNSQGAAFIHLWPWRWLEHLISISWMGEWKLLAMSQLNWGSHTPLWQPPLEGTVHISQLSGEKVQLSQVDTNTERHRHGQTNLSRHMQTHKQTHFDTHALHENTQNIQSYVIVSRMCALSFQTVVIKPVDKCSYLICGEWSLLELLNIFSSIGCVVSTLHGQESMLVYSIVLLWSQSLLWNVKAQMSFLNQRPTGAVNRLNTPCWKHTTVCLPEPWGTAYLCHLNSCYGNQVTLCLSWFWSWYI